MLLHSASRRPRATAGKSPLMTEPPLVLQPTLEGLTPMFQNPHRLLKLAQLAEVEGLDTMATFRLGPDTLVRGG